VKVIEGDFFGVKGRAVADIFKGDILELKGVEPHKFNGDFEAIKLISKDEHRPIFVIIILALTLIGIPFALLLALVWKQVSANVGFKTRGGAKFVANCDSYDWKVIRKYIGTGSLHSF
jgi:hypothetical protein